MAKIINYATLVDNIVQVSEDDSTEMSDYIPTAIANAEERITRDNDFPQLIRETTGNIVAGNTTVPEPTGMDYIHRLSITDALGERSLLVFKNEDWLVDYWPVKATQGKPKYYTLGGFGAPRNINIVPTADASYTYSIKYVSAPTPLSTTNATNYYVNECPDLLFYACMVEIVMFQKAWSQMQIWEQRYQGARSSWLAQASRQRRDSGNTPLNPEGGQNTLTLNESSNSTA